MMRIDKSFEWVPLPGLNRAGVMAEVTEGCLYFRDMPPSRATPWHVWVTRITNNGTLLFCYVIGLYPYEDSQTKGSCWFVKRIPECDQLDVYDCPLEFLDAAIPMGKEWRAEVMKRHEKKR